MNLSTFLSAVKEYPRGVIEEFRKIDWPEWKETRQLTTAVLIVVLIATILVGALDMLFTRMTQLLLG